MYISYISVSWKLRLGSDKCFCALCWVHKIRWWFNCLASPVGARSNSLSLPHVVSSLRNFSICQCEGQEEKHTKSLEILAQNWHITSTIWSVSKKNNSLKKLKKAWGVEIHSHIIKALLLEGNKLWPIWQPCIVLPPHIPSFFISISFNYFKHYFKIFLSNNLKR